MNTNWRARFAVGIVVSLALLLMWHRFDGDPVMHRGPVRTTTTQPRTVP